MTHQTEHTEEMSLQEVLAKPPPSVRERRETPLFQTMDELRVRHGNLPAAKDRLYLWAVGF